MSKNQKVHEKEMKRTMKKGICTKVYVAYSYKTIESRIIMESWRTMISQFGRILRQI